MLSCHKATQLMSEGQDRPLTQLERLSLSLHTKMCKGCCQFKRQLPVIRSLAHTFAHRPNTSPPQSDQPDTDHKDREDQ